MNGYHREKVTVRKDYTVRIPKFLIDDLNIKPGMEVSMSEYAKSIQMVPLGPISDLRGAFPGVSSDIEREGHPR
jgi:hypothetical protein